MIKVGFEKKNNKIFMVVDDKKWELDKVINAVYIAKEYDKLILAARDEAENDFKNQWQKLKVKDYEENDEDYFFLREKKAVRKALNDLLLQCRVNITEKGLNPRNKYKVYFKVIDLIKEYEKADKKARKKSAELNQEI